MLNFVYNIIILFVIIFEKPCLRKDSKGCMYVYIAKESCNVQGFFEFDIEPACCSLLL